MDNQKNRDTARNADPQDWQNAEKNESLHADPQQYSGADARNIARTNEEVDERLHARPTDGPDEEEDTEEDAGDWGHVDPAEGNSPFPDPNDPSGPGSAV